MALPLHAMDDTELTALDLRVLGCISSHDRFGHGGRGCDAKNATMAAEVACTVSSLSRSIRTLIKAGYVVREQKSEPGKRNQTAYRVLFDLRDLLPKGATTDCPKRQQQLAPNEQKGGNVVVRDERENCGNPPRNGTQYIPLKGEDNLESAAPACSAEQPRAPLSDEERREVAASMGELLRDLTRGTRAMPDDDDGGTR